MSNMKATLLVRRRVVLALDAFVEIVVWQVPRPVRPSVHPFRYRLAYIVGDARVVRYDDERGKGDHRHFGATEEPYRFTTPDRLLADFSADIGRWDHENGRA